MNHKTLCPICKKKLTGHSELQIKICKMITIKQFANNSPGFAFNSWTERLEPNSTRIITKAPYSNSAFDLFSSPNDNSTFHITSFGNFDANLRDAPSPIPKEIWISLFGISLSVLIPSILRWYNGWRQRRNLDAYIQQLPLKYNNSNQKKISEEVLELYTQGKINESQHKMLIDKIAEHFDQNNK
jgi:hypothetical protein